MLNADLTAFDGGPKEAFQATPEQWVMWRHNSTEAREVHGFCTRRHKRHSRPADGHNVTNYQLSSDLVIFLLRTTIHALDINTKHGNRCQRTSRRHTFARLHHLIYPYKQGLKSLEPSSRSHGSHNDSRLASFLLHLSQRGLRYSSEPYCKVHLGCNHSFFRCARW